MIYFIFECKNCDIAPAYLANATKNVLCGNCRTIGTAQSLTDEQVTELGLPTISEVAE
jgi:hypothetical protein